MQMLTSPGDSDPPAHPAEPHSTQCKHSAIGKHWHHSHCFLSLALEWIHSAAALVMCWISSAFLPVLCLLHSGSTPDPPPLEPLPFLFLFYWQSFFIEPVFSIFCLRVVFLQPLLCMAIIHCSFIIVEPSSLRVHADPPPPNMPFLFFS